MKDKIFIGWSGNNDAALKIKRILENDYNYICCIGGNADNSSNFASVGDTVIQQIKSCNQAIMIFQNKADGSISNNLFFELGYVFSSYGAKKVHCVKKGDEQIVLPSDFDNSFVEPIKAEDEDKFVDGIIKYFLGRQKMSIDVNKMMLINNRYRIHDILQTHYSEVGSRCSDYELAQYVLFYMQAAQMFGDCAIVERELQEFKKNHYHEFSSELALSIDIALNFFELSASVRMGDGGTIYVDESAYFKFISAAQEILEDIQDDEAGTFDEWARVFASEHMTWAHNLYCGNIEDVDDEMREIIYNKTLKSADECMRYMEILEKSTPSKENNDGVGLISIFKSYLYRNIYIAKKYLNHDDLLEWMEKAKRERKTLLRNFDKGSIDSKIYDNFRFEYYLAVTEWLSEKGNSIDKFEKKMHLKEINGYLRDIKEEDDINLYIKRISEFCHAIETQQ